MTQEQSELLKKRCTKCKILKTLEEFDRCSSCKNGRRERCKECRKTEYQDNREEIIKRAKINYIKNKPKIQKYKKEYAQKNKTKLSKKLKKYYKENKDRLRENGKKYYQKNKDLFLIASRKRKALKKSSSDGTITKSSLEELLQKQNNKCHHCGCELDETKHLDHYIPLSKGGIDSIINVVWSCARCNLTKQATMPKTLLLI